MTLTVLLTNIASMLQASLLSIVIWAFGSRFMALAGLFMKFQMMSALVGKTSDTCRKRVGLGCGWANARGCPKVNTCTYTQEMYGRQRGMEGNISMTVTWC